MPASLPLPSFFIIVTIQIFILDSFEFRPRQDAEQIPANVQRLLYASVCTEALRDLNLLKFIRKLRIQLIDIG